MKRLAILLSLALWLLLPATALADNNPLTSVCQAQGGAGKSSELCSVGTKTDPITGTHGVIFKATLIIATIAGIAAVIIVVIGGFMLVTANGDSQKVAQARTAIIGAAVGLVLIGLATSIVVFVVGRI
jgi:hypothetical protein